jgi:hypothetical protein
MMLKCLPVSNPASEKTMAQKNSSRVHAEIIIRSQMKQIPTNGKDAWQMVQEHMEIAGSSMLHMSLHGSQSMSEKIPMTTVQK